MRRTLISLPLVFLALSALLAGEPPKAPPLPLQYNKEDGLEGNGGWAEQSSRVQAIVNFYGPTDFSVKEGWNPNVVTLLTDFIGTTDLDSPVAKKASPVTYIDSKDPPVLTFHGSQDLVVPVDQARRLHAALKKAGVNEKLVILDGGQHGFSPMGVMPAMLEFLDANLKGQAAPAQK